MEGTQAPPRRDSKSVPQTRQKARKSQVLLSRPLEIRARGESIGFTPKVGKKSGK